MDDDAVAAITDMVKRETEAWNRKDPDGLVALFHPDMVNGAIAAASCPAPRSVSAE